MGDALTRLLEASGKQQGRGDQSDQLRRAEHQLLGLLLMQSQQQHDGLLFEQLLETEMLQQADGNFVLFGQQGLFERSLPVQFGGKPLTGTSMPGAPGRPLLVAHQPGQGRKYLQPVWRVLPGLDETAQFLQRAQALSALARAEQVIAEPGIEAWQVGQHPPGFGELRGQVGEELMFQVIVQGVRPSGERVVA